MGKAQDKVLQQTSETPEGDFVIEVLSEGASLFPVHGAIGSTNLTVGRAITHLYVEYGTIPSMFEVKEGGGLIPFFNSVVQRRIVATLDMDEHAVRELIDVLQRQLTELTEVQKKQ